MATIFTPQNPSPRNEVRDMSTAQTFVATVDGVKCTDFQIRIYKVSDNTLVHNSTKLALTPQLSNGGQILYILTGGTISNTSTDSYKWTIQVWNGAETVTTREFQFFAKTTPVLTFTVPPTITSQSYEFTATLTQAQGDIVNTYEFELYTSTNELIESSGQIQDFNISHTFTGFANGDNFKVRLFGLTTGGQDFDSGKISFSVSYSQPSLILVPSVEVFNELGATQISRGEVVQITGVPTGTIEYQSNIEDTGKNALRLPNTTSTVTVPVDVPLDFTLSFAWEPLFGETTYDGDILDIGNGAYRIFYTLGRFGYTINGVTIYLEPTPVEHKMFYITALPTRVVIKSAQNNDLIL